MKFTLLAIAGVAVAAQAQVSYPPPDLSQYATNAGVSSAITAATPTPCPAPLSDALVATAGAQPTCMPRPDAQRATLFQATTAVTASDGSFSGNWPAPFPSAPTGRLADIDLPSATALPYKCNFIVGSVTATSYAGKCYQLTTNTLPATAPALLGYVTSPVVNAAAGLTVRVVGRQ